MCVEGRTGGRVIEVVRQSDSDRHAERLSGSSYRQSGGDRQSDRLGDLSYRQSEGDRQSDGQVYRLDEWSDDVGQPD